MMRATLTSLMALAVAAWCLAWAPALEVLAADESGTPAAGESRAKPPEVKESKLGETRNVHTCGSLFLTGQFGQNDIEALKKAGIKRVISLRKDGEVNWDYAGRVREAGLEFVHVPFREAEELTDEVFDRIRKLLNEANAGTGTAANTRPDAAKEKEQEKVPTLLHCGSANRVGAVWMTHRVLDQGVDIETALAEAKKIGLRSAELEARARQYIQRQKTSRAPATEAAADR